MARIRQYRKKTQSTSENPFLISFSDLIAALLLVFVLTFVMTAFTLQKERETHEAERKLRESQQDITEKIVKMLMNQFQNEYHLPVQIHPDTGTITVSEGILFDYNSAELTPNGQAFLQNFIPKYSDVLFRDPNVRDKIAAVIVEGHTDSVGSYRFNMKLSLRRALSVIEYIFSSKDFPDFQYQTQLQENLNASGRSKAELKNTPTLSRRVEFKFRVVDVDALNASVTQ
jgi:outer membrane protein OmpA-like peptidoglycan-associated protein